MTNVSATSDVKQSKYKTISQLVRLNNRLDLILHLNLLEDLIEVRQGVILDISPYCVTVSQTSPPIVKSMISRQLETSLVYCNPIDGTSTRWGWTGRILELNEFKLSSDRDETVPAFKLSALADDPLSKTNLRLHYRVPITSNSCLVEVKAPKHWAQGSVLDISSGGLSLALPDSTNVEIGQIYRFLIRCHQADQKQPPAEVHGEAEVVRLVPEPELRRFTVGIKFISLENGCHRGLQKTMDHYLRKIRQADF